MAQVGSDSVCMYGVSRSTPGGGGNAQTVSETFAISATSNARAAKLTKRGGRFSIHYYNETASGATSTLTVWYSNLPSPDPTNDAHWVQDTNIGSVDMTTTATASMFNVGNVFAEWIRFKPNVATSAGKGWLWFRAEGTEV